MLRVLIAVPVAAWVPGLLPLAAAWLLPVLAGTLAAWPALRRCHVKCGFTGNPVRRGSRHPNIKATIQHQPHCRRVAATGKVRKHPRVPRLNPVDERRVCRQ